MNPPHPQSSAASGHTRDVWIVFGLTVLVIAALVVHLAGLYGQTKAIHTLERQGRLDAGLKVALLRAVLERPRALPFLLSRDRDVEDALRLPVPGRLADLSRKLEDLVRGTSASVLYVIDHRGVALSSSNWREPSSFVGSDYAFRAYFSQAMANGTAEHFALGNVSRRPGLYISHRVGGDDDALGVVVVKAEFDQLESDWRDSQRPTYVVDQDGVVLITSIPSWRFMTMPGSPVERLSEVRRSLQFGEALLLPLPISYRRD